MAVPFEPPERFNIADYFLRARLRQGKGDRTAVVCGNDRVTYAQLCAHANRFGNTLRDLGVKEGQRVIVALPDIPEYVAALFGVLSIGGVVVMVNPGLRAEEIARFYDYTTARVAILHPDTRAAFEDAARVSRHRPDLFLVGGLEYAASDELTPYATCRDDPAIWLFSGGTTGRPKAVVQTHRSFANTTEMYAKRWLGYREDDVTLSVPKLYFGYATGSNLFFPFSVGATSVLFPERVTADVVFDKVRTYRPTILVNVPTMVSQMVSHPDAARQDLSCLRFATSAGEALPVDLHERWKKAFGVELLDGLGTAEMWHIFVSNRPGDVRPGTLGRAVDGFEVRVRDDDGRDLPPGEVGGLWVAGGSRALGYHSPRSKSGEDPPGDPERTASAFRGEWYVTGDLVERDSDGYFSYRGRADDMLKVGGKWVAPREVENALLEHPLVRECAVVGVPDAAGLVRPRAYVVAKEARDGLDRELMDFVKARIEPHKCPREILFVDSLPTTHLGEVDRGKLRSE